MKMVEALIKPCYLDEVKDAPHDVGINGRTVTDAGTGNWPGLARFGAPPLRANLGLRLHNADRPARRADLSLARASALELYERHVEAGDALRRRHIEVEIRHRLDLDPQPGQAGYWAAFNDAYSLIRGLEAAERAAHDADHAYANSYCDEASDCFDGSYAEFKAVRLDRCVDANDRLAALHRFAQRFPMVAALRA
jgi:hypothetical protein